MDEKKLNLETWLECWREFPEMDEDNVKDCQEILNKLKIFVKAADETGSSPKTALAARAIMEAMYGLTSECKSREFAAKMEHTLSDLRTIAEQLTEQDLETTWKRIGKLWDSIKSYFPGFGQELQDIRKDCHDDPRQGLECVKKQLQDMHKDYITNQIKWQCGLSLLMALYTLWESWTTFSILHKFSIAKDVYNKTLKQVVDTLSDVEERLVKLINDFRQGLPVKPDAVHMLLFHLQRGTMELDKAKSLLQENKNNVSARRSEHLAGSFASVINSYRSISEYLLAASAGVNPFYQALAAVSASLGGISALVHGTMAYKCHKAIAEADALLTDIKTYETKLENTVKKTEEFLRHLRIHEKVNSQSATQSVAEKQQMTVNTMAWVVAVIAILVALWQYFTYR